VGSNRRRTGSPQDNELDSAVWKRRACSFMVKPETHQLRYRQWIKRELGAQRGWRRNAGKVICRNRGDLPLEVKSGRSQSPHSTEAAERPRESREAKP
jgi:hypothetical protein